MSYLKKMDYKQFAELLLTMKDGDVIEFACYPPGHPLDSTKADHFAKLYSIPEYQSNYILLDCNGGEEAYAIPLNKEFRDYQTEEDILITSYHIHRYFDYIDDENDQYVYVKM